MLVPALPSLFLLLRLCHLLHGFNLDTVNPLFRLGPPNSSFGFSLALHFRRDRPTLLVGAPRAESGQPGTSRAGAVFSCDLLMLAGQGQSGCERLLLEYAQAERDEARRRPDKLNSKTLHPQGKDQQLLGFSVHSSGNKGTHGSRALACAPLLRWSQNAYTDGVCYLLNHELNHTGLLNTCGPLPKKDRHNDYGTCEQGFSVFIDQNVTLTGLPGARKWTGGVFARYEFDDAEGFPDSVDRWTMEVDKAQGGILALLTSHDYLGYSVRYGRFGFWHEDAQNFTVVSGATRLNQTGAVLFLPFRRTVRAEEQRQLGLLDDLFLLRGDQLGSGFGYALEVLDLDNDGFDDLLVGAPFHFHRDQQQRELSGAVFVFYSRGARQPRGASDRVFREPIVLRGREPHSQFGAALSRLDDLDKDPEGAQDFCVGAPNAQGGTGAVFVFHGARREHFVEEPVQEIWAKQLKMELPLGGRPLMNFGAALAGGVDIDGDGYGELAVGAPGSGTAVVFRARPVLEVRLGHRLMQKYVKIDDNRGCEQPSRQSSCFSLSTSVVLLPDRHGSSIRRSFGGQTPFQCSLQLLSSRNGGGNSSPRALFSASGTSSLSWPCGEEQREHRLFVVKGNQDWTNVLRLNFSLLERQPPPSQGHQLLLQSPSWPAVRPAQRVHLFDIAFDKHCGEDNECHTDLALDGVLLDLTMREDGLYTAKVTEQDAVVVRLLVENRGERAYLAKLYLDYEDNELDRPRLLAGHHRQQNSPAGRMLDMERAEAGTVVLGLGNPLEAGQKLSFDLSFRLVRGSSERVSASLRFSALLNSSSVEENPGDNRWEAEVQLVKEADLQLAGVSRPSIVHFSNGNPSPSDEMDIGNEIIHAFTLTNRGPFYARNVTVKIDWPLRVNLPRSSASNGASPWLLYALEEPLVRWASGQFRRCQVPAGLVNPLGVYNDETLKLDYQQQQMNGPRIRRPRASARAKGKREGREAKHSPPGQQSPLVRLNGLLQPKLVYESSGARVRVVDINCKDGSALCVQYWCFFDYIGSNDSALIEVRARLWNFTFSAEDYRSFDYVAIHSEGFIKVDPVQGILENLADNFARVTTHAYPDRPLSDHRLELWLLLLAILIGLVLLALLVLLCWIFGFFRRKRPDLHLHQANYMKEREESMSG